MIMDVNIAKKDYRKHIVFKNPILKDITFRLKSGDSLLIVSGSGCGKSTFMKAFLGETGYRGRISVGGNNGDIGYVSQTDVLDEREVVYDAICYTARLCHPNMEIQKIEELVERIVRDLALNHVKTQRIHTLSGGQRKRVQVAQQLVRNTSVLLFDEADTGLDALTTYYLLKSVAESARKDNRIVMAISHNVLPENIQLFSHIMLLAKGADGIGTIAYFGTAAEVYRFFEKNSMLEILKEIQTKNEGGRGNAQKYIDKYRNMTAKSRKGY